MLCDIGPESVEEAQRILTLLCFSSRPMSVMEIIEAIAVDIHDQQRYDCDRRLESSEDLLRICPGLIDIQVKQSVYQNSEFSEDEDYYEDVPPAREVSAYVDTVRIAHFSVQEFLLSDRIKKGRAAGFAMSAAIGHLQISKACLIYLCDEDAQNQGSIYDRRNTFARFAAQFWHHHWGQPTHIDMIVELGKWIQTLFSVDHNFDRWIRLHDIDLDRDDRYYHVGEKRKAEHGSCVYYASLLGFDNILSSCLTYPEADVNAQGGRLGSALCAASEGGQDQVVQMLIGAGADVNAQGGRLTALEVASKAGHEKVVQLLLKAGADVNARGRHLTALEAAIEYGHEKIVQLLLKAGAHVNVQGVRFKAFQSAIEYGHEVIVQMLVEAGADVNHQGGIKGTALQVASLTDKSRCEKVVQVLLDAGANVNAQGRDGGNALHSAADRGNEKVVKMLLHAGAEVNARGGDGSALQAAIKDSGPHTNVIQMLLDAGAEVNSQGVDGSSPLNLAVESGNEKAVEMLLHAGADVNARGVDGSSPLYLAAESGNEKAVEMLLHAGAEVNARGVDGSSPLYLAAECGDEKMVEMLVQAGAEVNARGGEFGSALQAARDWKYPTGKDRYERVIQILLDAGAIDHGRDSDDDNGDVSSSK